MSAGNGVLVDPADGKMLYVVDMQVVGYIGAPNHFDVSEPRCEFTKHRSHLPSGQVGAKAEVVPVPKGQVEVRVACDIELIWVDEGRLITIC